MTAPPIPAEEFDYQDKTHLAQMLPWAGSDRALAEWAGVSESVIGKWRRRYNIPVPQEVYRNRKPRAALPQAEPEPPEEAVGRDRELLRLKTENKELRRKYAVACKTGNLNEDLVTVAREVFSRPAPTKILPPKVGLGKTSEDVILGLADWHGGEVVDYDVMRGYNAYNPQIMCRRAQYVVDHSLKILFASHQGTTFERLYVFDLGDGINGDGLPEQMATNALPVFEAMRLVALLKARVLTELSSHIPVTYICVPGNHGRRSPKMQWKLPTETADWLMGQMIADLTRESSHIECIVPKSWTAGITVRGHNHVLNHGFTAAKGGYGGISWYSFQRADGQKTAIEAAHGKRVHYRWYGHIHQKAEVPMTDGEGEQFIVSSLKGGDEYALEGLNRYSAPSQKLVGCHEDYGVTWRYSLDVAHGDETESRYEELL